MELGFFGGEMLAHCEGGRETEGRRRISQGPEKGQKDAVFHLSLVVFWYSVGRRGLFGSLLQAAQCVSAQGLQK